MSWMVVDLGAHRPKPHEGLHERLGAAMRRWRRDLAHHQLLYNIYDRVHHCWATERPEANAQRIEVVKQNAAKAEERPTNIVVISAELGLYGCVKCGRTHLCRGSRDMFAALTSVPGLNNLMPVGDDRQLAADPCPLMRDAEDGHYACVFSGRVVETGALNVAQAASFDDWLEQRGRYYEDLYGDEDAAPQEFEDSFVFGDSHRELHKAQFYASASMRRNALDAHNLAVSHGRLVRATAQLGALHRKAGAQGAFPSDEDDSDASPAPDEPEADDDEETTPKERKHTRARPPAERNRSLLARTKGEHAQHLAMQRHKLERLGGRKRHFSAEQTARLQAEEQATLGSGLHGEYLDIDDRRTRPALRDLRYWEWFHFTGPSSAATLFRGRFTLAKVELPAAEPAAAAAPHTRVPRSAPAEAPAGALDYHRARVHRPSQSLAQPRPERVDPAAIGAKLRHVTRELVAPRATAAAVHAAEGRQIPLATWYRLTEQRSALRRWQAVPTPAAMMPGDWMRRLAALIQRLVAWPAAEAAARKHGVRPAPLDEYVDVLARWVCLLWMRRPALDVRPISVLGAYFLHAGLAPLELAEGTGATVRLLEADGFARALHAERVVESAFAGAIGRQGAAKGVLLKRSFIKSARATAPATTPSPAAAAPATTNPGLLVLQSTSGSGSSSSKKRKRASGRAAAWSGKADAAPLACLLPAAAPQAPLSSRSDSSTEHEEPPVPAPASTPTASDGSATHIAFAPDERCTLLQVSDVKTMLNDVLLVDGHHAAHWFLDWFHDERHRCWPRPAS